MDVEIVFSDLDGTLLTTGKEISPATMDMLEELGRRGIEFVPASGRALSGIPHELLALDACHYAICSNGARILRTEDGAVLHEELMGTERARALFGRVRGLDATFDIFADGKIWSERRTFERMDSYGIDEATLRTVRAFRTVTDRTPGETLSWIEETGGHLERITLFWGTPEVRDAAIAAIAEDPTLAWTNSVPHDIEVLDARASKGAALAWLCRHLGIPRQRSVAFGDGLNDAPLLAAAGFGVALADAVPKTKAAADALAASNDEDGVAHTLGRLLEIS